MKKLIISIFISLFIITSSFATSADQYYTKRLSDLWIITKKDKLLDYNLWYNVLRQEIAAVALGLANVQKKSSCNNSFKDVSSTLPNTWACYSVEALAEKWIIAKNEYFRPEAEISKAESIWMIVTALYGKEYSYNSTKWWNWQSQVVDFAAKKWIVENFSDYDSPATRWFVFKVASNALDIKDWKSIFIWEKKADDWTLTIEDVVNNDDEISEDIQIVLCELLWICK